MLEASSQDARDTELVSETIHRKPKKASKHGVVDLIASKVVAEIAAGSSDARMRNASNESSSDTEPATGSGHQMPERASTPAKLKDNISKMRAVAAMFLDRSPSAMPDSRCQEEPDTEPVIQSAIRSSKKVTALANLSDNTGRMRAAAVAMSNVSKVVRVLKDGGWRNSSYSGRHNSSDGGGQNSSEAGPNRRMSTGAAENSLSGRRVSSVLGPGSPKRKKTEGLRRASDTVRRKSIQKAFTLADVSERHRDNSMEPDGTIQLRVGKQSTASSSGFTDLLFRRQLISIAKANYAKLSGSEESESPSKRKFRDVGRAVHSAVKQIIVRKHVVASFFAACCSQEVKRKVRNIIYELQWSALDKKLLRPALDKITQDLHELKEDLQCRVTQHGEAWELMSLVDAMQQDLADQIEAAERLFRCYVGLKACEAYLADDPKDAWKRLFQANAMVTGVERQWMRLLRIMSYTGMPIVKCSAGCEPRLDANPEEYLDSLPGRAIVSRLPEATVWRLREDLRRSGTNDDRAQARCFSELREIGLDDTEQLSMVVHFLCNQVWHEVVFEALYCLTTMRTQATDELRNYLVELENLLERDHPNTKPLHRPATPPLHKSDPSQAAQLREIIKDKDDVYDDEDDENSGMGSDNEEPVAIGNVAHYVILNAEATAGNPFLSTDDSNWLPCGTRHPTVGLPDMMANTSDVASETLDGCSSGHPSIGGRHLSVGKSLPSSRHPSSRHKGNELPEVSAAFSGLPERSAALEFANVSGRPSVDSMRPAEGSRRLSMDPSSSASSGTIMLESSGSRRPSINRSISAQNMALNSSVPEQLEPAPVSLVSPRAASPLCATQDSTISDVPLHDAAPSQPSSDASVLQAKQSAALSEVLLHESPPPPKALSSHARQHAVASEVSTPAAARSQDAWLGQVRQLTTISHVFLHGEKQVLEPLSAHALNSDVVSEVPLLVAAPSSETTPLQGRHTATVPAMYQIAVAPSSDALPLEARQAAMVPQVVLHDETLVPEQSSAQDSTSGRQAAIVPQVFLHDETPVPEQSSAQDSTSDRQAATVPQVFLHDETPVPEQSSAQDSTSDAVSEVPVLATAPSSDAFSAQGKQTTRLTATCRRTVAVSTVALHLQARTAAMIPAQLGQHDPGTDVRTALDIVDAWPSGSVPSKHVFDQSLFDEESCLEVDGLHPHLQTGIMKQSVPDLAQESVLPSFVTPLEDPTRCHSCSTLSRVVSPQTAGQLDPPVGSATPRRPCSSGRVSPSPEEAMMPALNEFTGHLWQRWRQVQNQKRRGAGRSGASPCWYSQARQRGILDGNGPRHSPAHNASARKKPVFLVADSLITPSAISGFSRSFVNMTPSSLCISPKSRAQSECLRRRKKNIIAATPTFQFLPVLAGSSQCATAHSSVVSRPSIGARHIH